MIPQLQELAHLCLCALPLWCAVRVLWFLMHKPRSPFKPLREAMLAVFAVFMAGIMTMALDGDWAAPGDMLRSAAERIHTGSKIHLRPFQTIWPQICALPGIHAVTQLLGNTLLFFPWGFFLPLLWPRFRSLPRMLCMALLLTLTIESTQLFINRYVEIDDVLLNFLGSMLGAGIWTLLHHQFPTIDRYLL